MTEEIWKPVVGYEGLYEVSSLGRVKSVFSGKNVCFKAGRLKTPTKAKNGYFVVNLFRPPGRAGVKQFYVHRLVLETFVGTIPKGSETRHLDGSTCNNNLENLQIGTPSDNQQDKHRHGTMPIGEKHWNFIPKNIPLMAVLRQQGATFRKIGQIVGLSDKHVWKLLNRHA